MAIKNKQPDYPTKMQKSPIEFDDLFAATTDQERKADKLAKIAMMQCDTSMRYKEVRMSEIQKSIDLASGKTKKALKGRWNVPLPLMAGFHDTLLSKTDDAPTVKFGHQDIADMPRARKVQAKFEQDSGDVDQMWALKDRMEKSMAIYSGVGISKIYAYNDKKGNYHSCYDIVDYLDFECEPMGGQILKNHKFMGQRNIFKTRSDLMGDSTGDNPIYNKKQVLKLIATVGSEDYKQFDKIRAEKTDRLKALGFAPESHSYMGVPVYNLTEWYMEDPETGDWWYLLYEARSGVWIRASLLTEVFESGEVRFVAWHTHPDPFNFWSKAPADDMRPVAEGMNIIFNQALDNREKKNYAQRAYDPAVFTDPAELEWRPDGLVETVAGISSTQGIGSGIYQFTVADMPESGTINLMTFMDQITGTKTGVTADAQGASDEKRVGIYFGNLQQVADRLGLYNKSYSEAWGRKGRFYYFGLREHIKTNKLMVQMVGDMGYNWVELVKEDTNPLRAFNITIVGGQAQAAADELSKRSQRDSLAILMSNPNFAARLNPDVTIEETLRMGGWSEASIKRFQDMQAYGSEEIIAEAHQAIEDILEGQTPKLNRSATPLFMQTIIDFASDSEDLDLPMYQRLMDFAAQHQQIALQNSMRKVRNAATMMGVSPGAPQGAPAGDTGAGGVIAPPGAPEGITDNLGFNAGQDMTAKGATAAGRAPAPALTTTTGY